MADLRTLVISSIPPNSGRGPYWSDLAEITWATMRKYCDQHGYTFKEDISDVPARVATPWVHERGHDLGWAPIRTMVKFNLFLHYLQPERCLEQWDHVIWLDADCLVTNYEIPLHKFTNSKPYTDDPDEMEVGDLILPYNIDGLHPTVIMMRNTPTTLGLAWQGTEAGMRMYQQHSWSDIMAFRFAIATPPYQRIVWWHPIRDLCAQPPGEYAMPKRAAVGAEWTPQSLTLHLSAMSISERIRIAKEYVANLGLL